ncbi:MAG TPA: hypothetical protein VG244_13220 [Acidimicrobiales bacterium]|jgi:hypothetical protein|nr:hypothetical protein [Acidimicrobiales bacterium]
MRGAGSNLRWAGRRALVGAATLLAAGALTLVTSPGAPPGLVAGSAGGVAGASTAPPPTASSYAIVDAAGGVMTFGGAGYYGDTIGVPLDKPIVGSAVDPNGGYWLVASDGGIFTYGQAQFFGSAGGLPLNKPVVGMARTSDGNGYWLVASDGGIFTYGDAQFYGSTGSIHLNKPIVGMAATSDGNGYWLVATDGGIFTYGDAQFWGSAGSLALNEPIVGMSPTPDGGGYWLVGQDAGVFTYGDAQFSGSAQSPLHPPLYPPPLTVPIAPVVTIMNEAPGEQATHAGAGPPRVAFAGDSLALYEGEYMQHTNPPYAVDDGAAAGCGFTNGAPMIVWSNPGPTYLNPGACPYWQDQLQWLVSRYHPDVTVVQTGYWESQIRQFNGTWETLADADYSAFIKSCLESAVQIAHSDGGAVILSTSPYFADGTPNNLVDAFNQILEGVAQEFPYVSIDDLHSVLDPGGTYQSVVNGIVARGPDGVHITEAAVDNLIAPALNQIIANVAGAVYSGDS